eukprot:CAMPEP_0172652422 /NCGR_PEP_ID=MMETSP1068-20121228/243303_1 /TAXON_ID=35684 /ORGANISM="Pseudopedinella elastica, Strain CCMP716" /LENGTH=836 /DNA_ID=CAMNT_0013466829 /DNA_START=321 /DNA_END=2832 /DNA_ORIENTATION=-
MTLSLWRPTASQVLPDAAAALRNVLRLRFFQSQAIKFYASDKYSAGQATDPETGKPVPGMLKGSAICTEQEVVCMDARCEATGLRNLCMTTSRQAYADISMTVLLFVLFALVSKIQSQVSQALDESIQTAQDYSVIVDDPGPDDGDAEEWRRFFGKFGHTTFITIAKDNGPLLRALSKRRLIMREIVMCVGNGEASLEEDDDGILDTTWEGKSFEEKINDMVNAPKPTDGKAKKRALIEKTGAFGMKPMKKWKAALEKVNAQLQEALNAAQSRPYVPSKIFVTFETETGQRNCLKALSMGTLTAAFDWGKDKIPQEYLFKGQNVLSVQEAPEPNEVFWEDVDSTFMKRIKQQTKTWILTCLLVVGSVIVCKQIQVGSGPGIAALWITLTNILVPQVLRKLCFEIEDHVSLNAQQTSLFLKLTFFRWMNTAVVIYLITDFTAFLTVKSLKQVQAVIMADALTTPIIRTLNPATLINQLVIANYAPTQEKANSYFLGDPWYPAERYADMTKTLFLALFYSVLYPAGLFLTCIGYAFAFTVDKYSLLRNWRTPSELDDDITKVSRGHLTLAVYFHSVMALVFFSEFPFDNICREEFPDGQKKMGKLEDWRYADAQKYYNVTTNKIHYRCSQGIGAKLITVIFGAIPTHDSMGGQQAKVVRVYATLVLSLTFLLFFVAFGKSILDFLWSLHHGTYKSETAAQGALFSECDIQAFIPIFRHPSLAYPLIAADTKTFETKYLPFELPKEELYPIQSLYNKAELPGRSDQDLKKLFSEVRYFPPPTNLSEKAAEDGDGVPHHKGDVVPRGDEAAKPSMYNRVFGGWRKKDQYEEVPNADKTEP